MKYDKVDTEAIRAQIIKTLKVMGMYKPNNQEVRRFINELVEVPIEESLIDRIMEVNEEERIIRTKDEVVTHLFVSNLLLGMEAVENGVLDDFMADVRKRFNETSPLNI